MRIELRCQVCPWHYVLRVVDLDDYDPAERNVCPACGGKVDSAIVGQGAGR